MALEDEELDSVALESTRTIDIDMFVPRDSIGWIWYDRPHYLVPDDPVGEEAFSVIRDAMATTDTVGISRLVLYRRERAVMLVPRDRGIVLWTLRYGDEVRDPEAYFGDLKAGTINPRLKGLVTKLIDERTKAWDPQMVTDPVQEQLLQIIAAKKKGKRVAQAEERARAREQRRQHHGRAAAEHRLGREAAEGLKGREPRRRASGATSRPAAARPLLRKSAQGSVSRWARRVGVLSTVK